MSDLNTVGMKLGTTSVRSENNHWPKLIWSDDVIFWDAFSRVNHFPRWSRSCTFIIAITSVMPILLFTVGPPAVGQLHDLLACLAKFNEDISIEATQTEVGWMDGKSNACWINKLRISSLNVSKTAYAAFTLSSNTFFEKYHFSPDQRGSAEPKVWTCRLQNRVLQTFQKCGDMLKYHRL